MYELSPKVGADGQTTWTHKTLHNFCATGGAACTDGRAPLSNLIADAAGNLYGTTEEGAVQNPSCADGSCGVVFELVRNHGADGQNTWTYKVLHRFCEQGPPCADGSNSHSGLLMTSWGRLYGDTTIGGAHAGKDVLGGTVFELTPSFGDGGQDKWAFKVLCSFCAQPNCSDGQFPEEQSLLADEAGNLYGVTAVGGNPYINCVSLSPGQAGCGTVFALTPDAAKISWAEKVLYKFCQRGQNNCADGATPTGGLIRDAAGRLYGATVFGGAYSFFPYNLNGPYGGTVFRLTPGTSTAVPTTWSEEVLHSFCALGGANCTDGPYPYDRLTMERGRLYGTTDFNGLYQQGTAFELPVPRANPPEVAADAARK